MSTHTYKSGTPAQVGDVMAMPGVPYRVTIRDLVACDDGCQHGAAAITDPESGEPDEVCLSEFVLVRRAE